LLIIEHGLMDNRVVRWGVLGCADIAIRRLIPAMHATPASAVVAIASRDHERAKAAARELDIPRAYASYADLLVDEGVDAVYIPLPNTLHAEWTVRTAEAGKHVLCEKPMATTVAECEQMVAACRRAGVRFMEAFMYRFHPQHARVRALIGAGAVGEPRLVRSSFCVRMQRPPEDIRFSPDLGGGALFDVGVYAIDAVRWLVGSDPLSVSGEIVVGRHGVDLSAAASLSFPNDILASVTCSFVANGGGSYEVVGSEGKITVPYAFALPPNTQPKVIWPGGEEEFPRDINQYALMLEAFSRAILDDTPAPIPDNSGTGNIAIIEALRHPQMDSNPRQRPGRLPKNLHGDRDVASDL
jgi:D-xylose 1-dehydrogenase (NADP+, D-xylono-1,5-lactone-forming)